MDWYGIPAVLPLSPPPPPTHHKLIDLLARVPGQVA